MPSLPIYRAFPNLFRYDDGRHHEDSRRWPRAVWPGMRLQLLVATFDKMLELRHAGYHLVATLPTEFFQSFDDPCTFVFAHPGFPVCQANAFLTPMELP